MAVRQRGVRRETRGRRGGGGGPRERGTDRASRGVRSAAAWWCRWRYCWLDWVHAGERARLGRSETHSDGRERCHPPNTLLDWLSEGPATLRAPAAMLAARNTSRARQQEVRSPSLLLLGRRGAATRPDSFHTALGRVCCPRSRAHKARDPVHRRLLARQGHRRGSVLVLASPSSRPPPSRSFR